MNNQQIIKIAKTAGILKNIKRQGWVLKGIKDVESVADHVFRVAFLAMLLSKDRKLDRDKVIKMVLVHDIGESLVGDAVYESGKQIIASLDKKHDDERKAMHEIFDGFTGKKEYLALWEEWLKRESKEAKLVKLVEKIEMALQALEYEEQGYETRLFDEFWENAEKYLQGSELEDLFEDLKKERKKLKKKKTKQR